MYIANKLAFKWKEKNLFIYTHRDPLILFAPLFILRFQVNLQYSNKTVSWQLFENFFLSTGCLGISNTQSRICHSSFARCEYENGVFEKPCVIIFQLVWSFFQNCAEFRSEGAGEHFSLLNLTQLCDEIPQSVEYSFSFNLWFVNMKKKTQNAQFWLQSSEITFKL